MTMYSLSTFRFAFLTISFFVQDTVAQYPSGKTFKPGYCNICRDAPNNSIAWRNIANPSQSFKMNGESWTCGYLQDTVQDVNPYSGAPGEARWCGLAQTFAEESCTCTGPDIPSMNDQVKDLNPACDLCKGQAFDYVPSVNNGLTANTGVAGNMNCQGLYNAMSQGVLTSNLCPTVIANAGPVCCNVETVTVSGGGGGGGNNNNQQQQQQQQCTSAAQVCQTNNDCCPGLQCKIKVLNGKKYCSSASTRPRGSIAGKGIGGAAGRSRAGN